MEDTLGLLTCRSTYGTADSLNPCFNGRYTRTFGLLKLRTLKLTVLILVLMEDTLGPLLQVHNTKHMATCLNPCFNGRYTRTLSLLGTFGQ